jgi:flavin-dependent dehydrogenase
VYDRLIGITWIGKSAATCPFTLVEAVEHGWVYASVMPDSRSTVVLMTDSDIYKAKRHQSIGFWDGELRQARHILEMFPETLQSYPQRILSASTILRMPCSGVNWLKLGEAAVSFDPISGQGVYQALAGAVRAGSVVEHYFRTGKTVRSYDAWVQRSFKRYQSVWSGYYSQERRWERSGFWRRRHSEPVSR